MNNLQPLPNYSLADLFRDINNGVANEFQYDGKVFNVNRNGFKWTVTDPVTGFTATTNAYTNCMLDLQGMGACLVSYNRSLVFDKEGNIIN